MTSPDTVTATVRIAAPPTAVFPYLVEPALLAEWLGGLAEMAPQPGGVFAVDVGESVRGHWVTIDPPRRVVFTWSVAGTNVLPPGSTTVEIVLIPEGQDTIVQLTHRGLPPAELGNHKSGWARFLDRLVHTALT